MVKTLYDAAKKLRKQAREQGEQRSCRGASTTWRRLRESGELSQAQFVRATWARMPSKPSKTYPMQTLAIVFDHRRDHRSAAARQRSEHAKHVNRWRFGNFGLRRLQWKAGRQARFFYSALERAMVKFVILFHKPDDLDSSRTATTTFLAAGREHAADQAAAGQQHAGQPDGGDAVFTARWRSISTTMRRWIRRSNRRSGRKRAANLARRFPAGTFEMYFAEVYEEAGAQTEVST